jgi:hypothetical protein
MRGRGRRRVARDRDRDRDRGRAEAVDWEARACMGMMFPMSESAAKLYF